jgi:site-specific DNA-adenine methylase
MKAPLPLLGNKRNWLKQILEIDFSNKMVLDLFGGTGLISHSIKQKYPTAHVIYNDYDHYTDRLKNIDKLEQLRVVLSTELQHCAHNTLLSESEHQRVTSIILNSNIDDFQTVGSWLLFSCRYANSIDDLLSSQLYNRIPIKPISQSINYLKDVIQVSGDFRQIMSKYADDVDIIIADPPYLSTQQCYFKESKKKIFFNLTDSVDLINLLRNRHVILFTSERSELEALYNNQSDLKVTKIVTRKSSSISSAREKMIIFN